MRRNALILLVLLAASASAAAGERKVLSRTLKFDFHRPGSVTVVASSGDKPVSEEATKNSYILVMPKKVKLTMSIGGDNEYEHWYHILAKIIDEERPDQKAETDLKSTQVVHNQWLAQYRYQYTFIQREVGPAGNFASATVRLDVFGPQE